jgi:glucans biosynthesis protein
MFFRTKGSLRRPLPAPFVLALALALLRNSASAFGLDDVAEQARELARAPYKAHDDALAPWLSGLSYDEYRNIRFKAKQSVWRDAGLPFELQFFHVGRGFTRALRLYELDDKGAARPLVVKRDTFDYRNLKPAAGSNAPAEIAGFRAHYPLMHSDYKDEVIAFLGASYFRAVGAGQRYGLSARGLAVDTTGGGGEEFPAFTSFWFERPAKDAGTLTLYALLDGPRVTGAYRFVVRPGITTVVDVQARIYLRAPVAMLGIAPLTSMFIAGENQPPEDGFRPEVHDSDGLQVADADGEWIWRPLTHPKQPFVTSFALAKSPRGFGLMQRDRDFRSYEDLEAHYERRPGAWIEPTSDWGAGRVELLQYHIPDESHDNIAAYWVPASLPPPGQPIDVSYRMHWLADDAARVPGVAHVVQTRRGWGFHKTPLPPDAVQFHIDFAGPALEGLPEDAPIEARVNGDDNVRALHAHAYPNPGRGGWRMTLDFRRKDIAKPVELRAFLRLGARALSETWSYALPAE